MNKPGPVYHTEKFKFSLGNVIVVFNEVLLIHTGLTLSDTQYLIKFVNVHN